MPPSIFSAVEGEPGGRKLETGNSRLRAGEHTVDPRGRTSECGLRIFSSLVTRHSPLVTGLQRPVSELDLLQHHCPPFALPVSEPASSSRAGGGAGTFPLLEPVRAVCSHDHGPL